MAGIRKIFGKIKDSLAGFERKIFASIMSFVFTREIAKVVYIVSKLTGVSAFTADVRASASTKDVIKLSIAAIIAGAILPTAVLQVSTVNTTGWNTSAQALWPLVPIFLVLGVALVFIKIVIDKL
jgi:hypothetical protein